MTPRIVTVDGPAGSGKTTLGRLLAAELRFRLVDTGLFYRAVMVAAVWEGLDASRPAEVARLARAVEIRVNEDPAATDADWSVLVDGRDPGELARDPRRAALLSELAAIPAVRAAVLESQRRAAGDEAVAVGRDCGTVVFPTAPAKIWLWAAPEVRALRRAAQLAAAGVTVDAAELEAEIAGRDALDAGRAVAPLRPASDAHMIDSGLLPVGDMVERALDVCRDAGLAPAWGFEQR